MIVDVGESCRALRGRIWPAQKRTELRLRVAMPLSREERLGMLIAHVEGVFEHDCTSASLDSLVMSARLAQDLGQISPRGRDGGVICRSQR